MPETNEALTGPEADAQVPTQLLAELEAGNVEVSSSEPVSELASEPPVAEQQAEEVEASGEQTPEAEESSNQTGDDESQAGDSKPDLEWIDEKNGEYADLLSQLVEAGHIDASQLEVAKSAYLPLKGFYAKTRELAEEQKTLKSDAEKWRETGAKLFDSEEAREDFIRWRDNKRQPQAELGEKTEADIAPFVSRIQNAETDEQQIEAIVDLIKLTSADAVKSALGEDKQQASAAERAQAEYAESLEDWAQSVSKDFTDLEGATQDDFVAATEQLASAIKRRGQSAADVIKGPEDLRDELRPYIKPIVLERKLGELMGTQGKRSKQYDDKTLKASSAPGTSTKAAEDLTTFAGRTKAISEDAEIQALFERTKGAI